MSEENVCQPQWRLIRAPCPEILAPITGGRRREPMRKIRIAVATVMVAAGLLTALAAPTSADVGGHPADGSCGLGKTVAHDAIADPTSPGATEDSHVKPSDIGCTGKAE